MESEGVRSTEGRSRGGERRLNRPVELPFGIAQFFVESIFLDFGPTLGRKLDELFEIGVDVLAFAAAAYRFEDAGNSLTVLRGLRELVLEPIIHFNTPVVPGFVGVSLENNRELTHDRPKLAQLTGNVVEFTRLRTRCRLRKLFLESARAQAHA